MRWRQPAGWLPKHISLMCGCYISFGAAFLVVNFGLASPLAWVLPTIVGSPLIALTVVRAQSGRLIRKSTVGGQAAASRRSEAEPGWVVRCYAAGSRTTLK